MRGPRKDTWQRKQDLEEDEWIAEVEEKRVKCKGCREWWKLSKLYSKINWENHKKTCAQIMGVEQKQVANTIKAPATAVSNYPTVEIMG